VPKTQFPSTGSALETGTKFVALPFQNAVLCSSCQCFHLVVVVVVVVVVAAAAAFAAVVIVIFVFFFVVVVCVLACLN
jgi:hypothetical protein